jgi:hypothetical protein
MKIDRHQDKWDNITYECLECNEIGDTVSSISHKSNCSVSEPDDVDYPFHESTKELIHNIIREVKWRREDVEFTKDLEPLTDIRGVHWDRRGSSNRIALGIGRTSPRGKFHLKDRRGLVLKIDPNVRWNKEHTPISGNIDELFTWDKALETSTDELFGEIITYSSDGMWLVMEECIPIYKSMGNIDGNSDALFDKRGNNYINPFISELAQNNWVNPDYKHGNIGMSDSGRPVVIDYGTGPEYEN